MKKKNGDISKILDEENKIYFIRRLYELIEHGYMLEDSIEFLLFQYDVSLEIIDSVKLELSHGKKLSDLLRYLGYSNFVISKMRFAEDYGSIEEMLVEIENYLRIKKEQKEKVIKTLRYPIILTIALITLIMVFNLLVIPQVENIYTSSSIKMDIQTIILIKIVYYTPKIISILVMLSIIVVVYMLYIKKYRKNIYLNTLMYIPKIKVYARLYYSYKFTLELSLFLMCGFSLKTALEVIIEENYDYYLTYFSKKIIKDLDKGLSFEEAIASIKFFDKSVEKFVVHGINNGLIDKELRLFSELMLDTFLTSLDKMLRKFQPVLFAILALVIIGLYMVILMPIFNMASSLK